MSQTVYTINYDFPDWSGYCAVLDSLRDVVCSINQYIANVNEIEGKLVEDEDLVSIKGDKTLGELLRPFVMPDSKDDASNIYIEFTSGATAEITRTSLFKYPQESSYYHGELDD